jgi:2-polyprenyl-6-methoxyphenol hydroxylase-like FAD-dependent oxidoreductase
MNADIEVVIVGAGPTGLLLAGDLARAGVSCAVLERRTGRSGLTRAFAVHARTLEELDARGMADELVATGTPVPELRFFAGSGLALSGLPSRFPFVLVTPQYQTERVLAERAKSVGADIRYGSEVTGLAQHPDGVEVQVQDGARPDSLIRAAYVVGTDGMHSTVRRAIGMPFPGRPVLRSVMLADVRLSQEPPEVVTANAVGDSFGFIAPFGDGWYRVIAWHRHDPRPESDPVDLAEISATARRAFGTDFGMYGARWLSRFHSEERQVPRYRDGRVLLAGDAAHVHSPVGGQGMNVSMQDAANLGWKLAAAVRGWAPDGLLDSYDAERHPVGRQVVRGSGALLRLALTGPPALVSARKLLASAAVRTPLVTGRIAHVASGVGVSYPAAGGAHPLVGKRVGDSRLADGRRLYEALRGGRFMLTGRDPLPGSVTSGYADRVESVTFAEPESGPKHESGPKPDSGTVTLVRPDAYIAWAAPTAAGQAAATARGVLERWCGAPALRLSAVRYQPTATTMYCGLETEMSDDWPA